MGTINVSHYGPNLAIIFGDPIQGLYTSNASTPLGRQQGLRHNYKFGLYSYCAYVNESAAQCSNRTAAFKFQPYAYIVSDMSTNYSQYTTAFYAGSAFQNSSSLGSSSQAAYWLLLFGTLFAVFALLTGVVRHTLFFVLSTCFAILGTILLLIGASIWTVALKKVETINSLSSSSTPLGIYFSTGSGLHMLWAAVACLALSIVPYTLSCCTYKG